KFDFGAGPKASPSRLQLFSSGVVQSVVSPLLVLPQATALPSGDQPTAQTDRPTLLSVCRTEPSLVRHRKLSWSLPPDVNASSPLGDRAPATTSLVCFLNSMRLRPFSVDRKSVV